MEIQRSLTKSRSLIPSVQEPENVPDVEDEQEQALHNGLLFQDGSDYNESNPVSLTKDGPNMKAWEEMRAPEDVHNVIIRSLPCATSRN